MSAISHITANPTTETPSTSETAVGGVAGGNLVAKDSQTTTSNPDEQSTKPTLSSKEPGSAELAAEKLFEERMELEYAKREGGA